MRSVALEEKAFLAGYDAARRDVRASTSFDPTFKELVADLSGMEAGRLASKWHSGYILSKLDKRSEQ